MAHLKGSGTDTISKKLPKEAFDIFGKYTDFLTENALIETSILF